MVPNWATGGDILPVNVYLEKPANSAAIFRGGGFSQSLSPLVDLSESKLGTGGFAMEMRVSPKFGESGRPRFRGLWGTGHAADLRPTCGGTCEKHAESQTFGYFTCGFEFSRACGFFRGRLRVFFWYCGVFFAEFGPMVLRGLNFLTSFELDTRKILAFQIGTPLRRTTQN